MPVTSSGGSGSSLDRVHVLEAELDSNTVFIAGRMSEQQPLSVSRLDLWTARNIGWEAGRISGVINSPVEAGVDRTVLYDRIIRQDSNGYGAQNLHMRRDGGEALVAGFTFNQSEPIGGLILVVGRGSPGQTKPRDAFKNFTLFGIQTLNDAGQWIECFPPGSPSINYREYVYDADEKTYYNYSDCPGRSLGWKVAGGVGTGTRTRQPR